MVHRGKNNARLIDEAYASENQIVTFPAGLCSRKINGQIQDTDWKKSFIQKAVEHQRDVVPVYFEGRNLLISSTGWQKSAQEVGYKDEL